MLCTAGLAATGLAAAANPVSEGPVIQPSVSPGPAPAADNAEEATDSSA